MACVLIADDELMVVRALTRQLTRRGMQVLSDTTSTKVQELARRHQPDLIILDLNQGVDGRELLIALKADPWTRAIPVVIVSGSDDEAAVTECLSLGAAAFGEKPFDDEFVTRMEALAKRNQLVSPERPALMPTLVLA